MLLLVLICKYLPEEYEVFPVYSGVGVADISPDDDPIQNSKNAYVSYYSGDDHWNHFLLNSIMIGYSLMVTSPEYDRVLLMPSGLTIPSEYMDKIMKVWTHVIRRPYMKWKCDTSENDPSDVHHWFKLQVFSLLQYHKLVLIGPLSIVAQNPSAAFGFLSPSAPPDYQAWGMSHVGTVRNHNFMVIQPTLLSSVNFTSVGCKWISSPHSIQNNIVSQYKDISKIGSYDNGLFEEIFYGNIDTLPYWWQYEVISDGFRNERAPQNSTDPRIVTYRYAIDSRPWSSSGEVKKSILSQAYCYCVIKMFEFFGENIDLQRYQLSQPSNEYAKFLYLGWNEPFSVDSYKVFEFYDEFAEVGGMREIMRCISLAIGAITIILFAVADAPESSRDRKTTELIE